MARLLVLAVTATVLMARSGQPASAAWTLPAEAFWRAALPDAPMPDAILELLPQFDHHASTEQGAYMNAETGTPEGAVAEDSVEDNDPPRPMNFNYGYNNALPRSEATSAPSPNVLLNRAAVVRNVATPSSAVFFLDDDAVRVGESLPFHRIHQAAAAAEASAEKPLELYAFRSVRVVEGSSFVVCRGEAGEGAVYGCRATGPVRAYVLALDGKRRDMAMTAVAVCRTDASRWDPEHATFRLLGVKPGGAAVCHVVPDAQVLPAMNGKSPATN
ncbi:BURP domain-containing protein 15-like [Triticum urartu]|uniref:BURP domain-containing protein 15-like n=1 Tax=Triticum urartu TaxID=4572 RepID=UPI0020445C0D|nr:BURP domain-containing protein 15-like [Triticum urartu]